MGKADKGVISQRIRDVGLLVLGDGITLASRKWSVFLSYVYPNFLDSKEKGKSNMSVETMGTPNERLG